MKAHKLAVLIIDFDDVGIDDIISILRHTKYPNRCIHPMIMETKTADIGQWSDDHPLNKTGTMHQTYLKLFGP